MEGEREGEREGTGVRKKKGEKIYLALQVTTKFLTSTWKKFLQSKILRHTFILSLDIRWVADCSNDFKGANKWLGG